MRVTTVLVWLSTDPVLSDSAWLNLLLFELEFGYSAMGSYVLPSLEVWLDNSSGQWFHVNFIEGFLVVDIIIEMSLAMCACHQRFSGLKQNFSTIHEYFLSCTSWVIQYCSDLTVTSCSFLWCIAFHCEKFKFTLLWLTRLNGIKGLIPSALHYCTIHLPLSLM